MRRRIGLVAVLVLCMAGSAYALYSVAYTGTWPKSWPKELEPLRKQAQTYVGPMIEQRHYLIPFTSREQFEAAWPELLKVKSPGAPIFLLRGPKTGFMEIKPAGIIVHAPPLGQATPEGPIAGVQNLRERWMNTTYFELVVDGKIVDLNRIPLPADTPIIDQRFEAKK